MARGKYYVFDTEAEAQAHAAAIHAKLNAAMPGYATELGYIKHYNENKWRVLHPKCREVGQSHELAEDGTYTASPTDFIDPDLPT